MRKILLTLVLTLLIGLVACKPKSTESFYEFLSNNKTTYNNSESGNIKLTFEIENEITEVEYIYNYNNNTINSLKLAIIEDEAIMEAYLNNNNMYLNINGEKTKQKFSNEDAELFITEYGVEARLSEFYKTFDESLMNAFDVISDSKGVAQLEWDKDKYVFIDDEYINDPDLWIEAEARFNSVKENVEDITMTINYDKKLITNLDSLWVYQDGSEIKIKIEFNGTSFQTIEFPTDLNDYKEINNED